MKILKVRGDEDFAANSFQSNHGGALVKDVIADIGKFLPTSDNDEYEQWELEVLEFEGSVDMKFLEFTKDFIEYDSSKHSFYYHESETV